MIILILILFFLLFSWYTSVQGGESLQTIHNLDINYIQYGKGEDIVLLHGWGQNIEMMKPLGDPLSAKYRITIIDFPGFGESAEPKEVLTITDYAQVLHDLLVKLKVDSPILIGHSFGGRVAIVYAGEYKTKKVVLFGAPCVRTKTKLTAKEKLLKTAKKMPGMGKIAEVAKNYIGSRDYKQATPMMRDILVKTVNEDLTSWAEKIEVPTLLVWGEYDQEAPLEEARLLEEMLLDGALIVLPGTHYAYLENLGQVLSIIESFVEEK